MADPERDSSFGYDNISRQNVTDIILEMMANVTPTTYGVNGTTSKDDSGPPPSPYALWVQVIIAVTVGLLIIATIVGNSLVCIAVGIVKRLQSPSNFLIVSLAVADLLVALLVMPFAMLLDIKGGSWLMGDLFCDVWTSLDVMLCTASILNLCMISVDRYFVITRPFQYAMKRTPKRMIIMIAMVWLASALISIPPVFGWKADTRGPYDCFISQNLGYQIYATLGAFYCPLTVMIVVYFKIWRVSSRIAKAENRSKVGSFDKAAEFQVGRRSKDSGDSHTTLPNGTLTVPGSAEEDEILPKKQNPKRRISRFNLKSLLPKNQRINHSMDSKATKTLGIIMGGFTACWLPFFILALVRPFCSPDIGNCHIPDWLTSALMWLGYSNSFFNPVIYARFNREFRTPFKEILCFRCKGINKRMRSESYVEQYGKDPSYKDSLRPPTETVVQYNSHGQTVVTLGNGSANGQKESKI